MKAMLLAILLPTAIFAAVYYYFFTPEARHVRAVNQLIEATSVDEMEMATFKLVYKESLARGEITASQLQCIIDVKREQFTRLFVPGIRKNLTLNEARAAVDYYRSALGAKVLRAVNFEMRKISEEHPIRVSEEPAFDIDEFEAMAKWRHSAAGEKTWDFTMLTDYAEEEILSFMRDRKAACKKQFP